MVNQTHKYFGCPVSTHHPMDCDWTMVFLQQLWSKARSKERLTDGAIHILSDQLKSLKKSRSIPAP